MVSQPSDNASGTLVVIAGCMFSGKTTRLIDRLSVAFETDQSIVAFKHEVDRRYHPTELATHDRRQHAAMPVPDAERILSQVGKAAVVGIDEAHFFGRPLVAACERLVADGREVIVAGLDHDAWGQAFPAMATLKEQADEIEELSVPCTVCHRPAQFSQRVVPLVDDDLVGGPGEYEPRCAEHFAPLRTPAPVYD